MNRDKYHDLRTQQLTASEALDKIQKDLHVSPINEELKLNESQAREHYIAITSSVLGIIRQ